MCLCEAGDKAPGMMKRLPDLADKLFATLMTFLLDVEDDPQWHLADTDEHEGALYNKVFLSSLQRLTLPPPLPPPQPPVSPRPLLLRSACNP